MPNNQFPYDVDGAAPLGLGDSSIWEGTLKDEDGIVIAGKSTTALKERNENNTVEKVTEHKTQKVKTIVQRDDVYITFDSPEHMGEDSFGLRFVIIDVNDPSVIKEDKIIDFPISKVSVEELKDGTFKACIPYDFAKKHGLHLPFLRCTN